MRDLFADGANSAAHILLGAIGYRYPPVLASAVVYQLVQAGENTPVDIAEIFCGFGLHALVS